MGVAEYYCNWNIFTFPNINYTYNILLYRRSSARQQYMYRVEATADNALHEEGCDLKASSSPPPPCLVSERWQVARGLYVHTYVHTFKRISTFDTTYYIACSRIHIGFVHKVFCRPVVPS